MEKEVHALEENTPASVDCISRWLEELSEEQVFFPVWISTTHSPGLQTNTSSGKKMITTTETTTATKTKRRTQTESLESWVSAKAAVIMFCALRLTIVGSLPLQPLQ